ncbi:MAG: cytochrome c [Gammaproteobacteria bacterium]|nr:cytochrome c [Gammaproteobacteria bacterium]
MATGRIPYALISGLVLVIGVSYGVSRGLYILSDGKIAEDPSQPTPATYAAVDRLMEYDPVRGARAQAGLEIYRHRCRLCHHRSGRGGGKFTPSLQHHTAESVVAILNIYRDGQKFGPMTDLMAPWARDLSQQEILSLGEYIEVLASVKALR